MDLMNTGGFFPRVKNISIRIIISSIFILWVPSAAVPADSAQMKNGSNKIEIIATFFPVYLFTRNITEGISAIKVDLLLPATYGCPHDFSLLPEDIKKIGQADIIVQNGMGMENFLTPAMASANSHPKLILATENITPIKLKYEENHQTVPAELYNPHAFASPPEAALMIEAIADRLIEYLPAYTEKLKANKERYRAKIDSLSQLFKVSLVNLKNDKIVTVHEVFDYMARAYHFEIADVIEKEPGQEPSAKEMMELAANIRQKQVAGLFSEPQYSSKIVKVLAQELDLPIYELDPVASGPVNPPADYYEQVMGRNLATLILAFKGR
ncbi:MAG: zinc ABC transporter substrate-binding protein [candidate division Zixibacteria bacterium]|nr:zinc ABC transporter substrate-binding protein [candidate division Zixibacteria bacterium]